MSAVFNETPKELLRQIDDLLHILENEVEHPKISVVHCLLHEMSILLNDEEGRETTKCVVTSHNNAAVAWQWRAAESPAYGWRLHCERTRSDAETKAINRGHTNHEVRPLYTHPPALPAPTAERADWQALDFGGEWCACTKVEAIRRAEDTGCAIRPDPHDHQASPAAPVGGVSERMVSIVWDHIGENFVINRRDIRRALQAALATHSTPNDGCLEGEHARREHPHGGAT